MTTKNSDRSSDPLLKGQDTNEEPRRSRNYGTITPVPPVNGDNSIEEVQESNAESVDGDPNNSNGSSTPDEMRSTLSFIQKIGFGLGHVYNDLCAGVWFSYTLLYMQGILLISAPEAGSLVMLGQVADAISTPIVGLLIDRYGTKRKWHIFGTGLVFITFPLIFSICPWCSTADFWWPPLYFAILIIVFQFAWALVQITHLAMIPEMSRTYKDRSDLTTTRYSASVCSNVVVYITTWVVLQGRDRSKRVIGPSDAFRFRDIALILTLVGVSMSVLFQFSLTLSGYEQRRRLTQANRKREIQQAQASRSNDCDTNEPRSSSSSSSSAINRRESTMSAQIEPSDNDRLLPSGSQSHNDTNTVQQQIVPRKNFLKLPILYQTTFLYVFSRLFLTTSLVYMPLWLDERSWKGVRDNLLPEDLDTTLGGSSVEQIASVPLVSFLASFIASLILKHIRGCGHELRYLFGSVFSISGCIWIAFATPSAASVLKLFGIAMLFGAGSSITMISSLCITAEMIGKHTEQGGFIYSAVTFADKLITGIVVVIIETLKCKKRDECPEYYRNVLAYGCGLAAFLGILTLSTLKCTKRPLPDAEVDNYHVNQA